MRVLAIETSCDETAIAIVRQEAGIITVEAHEVASQINTHAKYGGVVPEVAARMHVEALFPMLRAMEIPRDGQGIDAIAVTAGPGLVVALRVGVEAAKALAYLWNKPLVPVNHLEGHVASAFIDRELPQFPLLSLLVSGGHSEYLLSPGPGSYEYLGGTRDDAAGEAFDKVAKLLGLGYPGGPAVSKAAENGDKTAIGFPRPMLNQDNLDVSFSGLKTAVRLVVESGEHTTEDIAASFQEAVIETLATKLQRAIEACQPKSVTLVGGVSANTRLRERVQYVCKEMNVSCVLPERTYSTDNAAMIGAAGLLALDRGEQIDPKILKADPALRL